MFISKEITFFHHNKPIGASPRRDYVRSEEDGISTNSLVLLLSCLGNDTSKKGGSAPRATD